MEDFTEEQLRIMLEHMTPEDRDKFLHKFLEDLVKLTQLSETRTIDGTGRKFELPFHVK